VETKKLIKALITVLDLKRGVKSPVQGQVVKEGSDTRDTLVIMNGVETGKKLVLPDVDSKWA